MLLGYKIYNKSLDNFEFNKKKTIINTLNPHSYCIAKADKEFDEALKSSDLLLPDGVGIKIAGRILNKIEMRKISGFDLHEFLLKKANIDSKRVFYLGSNKKTLKLISDRISNDYVDIKCGFYSPPFKKIFSQSENRKILKKLNDFKPNLLFIGMTAPKQEKWAHKFKESIDAEIICSVGAVFNFFAGNVKRPSRFWVKLGLEWLARFVKEPRRLFKRNFVSTPKFALEVLFIKLFGKGFM
tara:strand:- start:7175 stop:7897 length:723 start_codon:yes stop_codon:yes gene_type:complete